MYDAVNRVGFYLVQLKNAFTSVFWHSLSAIFLVKNEICAMSKVWAFFFPTCLGLFHLGSGFCLAGVLFGGVGSFALCALVFMLCFCSTRSAVVVTTYSQ